METNYPRCNSGHSDSLELGHEFQDFVVDLLFEKIGLIVQIYSSKSYQYKCGESRQRIEIKKDNRHTDTKRLSIEIAEKSNGKNDNFVPSGIYSKPSSLFYVIGNYESVYLFSTKLLVGLHKTKKYEEATHPTKNPTIKKYYLKLEDAQRYCITHLTPIS